jgi:hypothetical protein
MYRDHLPCTNPISCLVEHEKQMRKNAEAILQQQVKATLVIAGYTVIEIGKSRGKVKCDKCNQYTYARGWQGNTVGAPDIYVHHKNWKHIAIGIELKTETGTVRKEQQEYASDNLTVICRSLECVINNVIEVDKMLGLTSKLESFKWI